MSQGYPGSGPYGQSPYGQSPYGGAGGAGPPPKRGGMSAGAIVALVLGIVGGVALIVVGVPLLCCGGMIFSANQAVQAEIKKDADNVITHVQNTPDVQTHIGAISSCTYNSLATGNEPGIFTEVYDVTGSLGSGQIIVSAETQFGDQPDKLNWGKLRLRDGQEFTLFGDPTQDDWEYDYSEGSEEF